MENTIMCGDPGTHMYQVVLNGQWHCQNQFHCLMSTVRWVRLRSSDAHQVARSQIENEFWIVFDWTAALTNVATHIVISADDDDDDAKPYILFIRGAVCDSECTIFSARSLSKEYFSLKSFVTSHEQRALHILPLVRVFYNFTFVIHIGWHMWRRICVCMRALSDMMNRLTRQNIAVDVVSARRARTDSNNGDFIGEFASRLLLLICHLPSAFLLDWLVAMISFRRPLRFNCHYVVRR